jgi:Ca2+/Na+ antiporter
MPSSLPRRRGLSVGLLGRRLFRLRSTYVARVVVTNLCAAGYAGGPLGIGCCCQRRTADRLQLLPQPAVCYSGGAAGQNNLAQRIVANTYLTLPEYVQDPVGLDRLADAPPPPPGCHEASEVERLEEDVGDDDQFCKTAFCRGFVFCMNLFLLLMSFLALAIICDDYLVPPIELFCERYHIPDEAAGASFLAFGSSAPEIVIATLSVLSGGGSETGLSTVLGSAVLAFGLIPAVSAMLAPPADSWDVAHTPPELYRGGLLLQMRPLVRDVSFAVCGFSLMFWAGADGSVSRGEALILVLGFFVYMAVIFMPIKMAEKQAGKSVGSGLLAGDHGIGVGSSLDSGVGGGGGGLAAAAAPEASSIFDGEVGGPSSSIGGGDGGEPPAAAGAGGAQALLGRAMDVLSLPIIYLCDATIPHEPEVSQNG